MSSPVLLAGLNPTTTGLDGVAPVDPVTFVVTLAGFIPAGFQILDGVCILIGLWMMVTAMMRQIETARGRGDFTGVQNLMHAGFGVGLALLAELIGSFGKGAFGEYQDMSILLYSAKQGGANFSKIAMISFLLIIQFVGAVACFFSIRVLNRLATNKPYSGDTPASAFWLFAGGLGCVFIQEIIGLFSSFTGFRLAGFINGM